VLLFGTNVPYARQTQDSLSILLDRELNNKQYYINIKEQKIEALKRLTVVGKLTLEQKYNINDGIQEEYRKYIPDSAIRYVEKNLEIASALNRKDMETDANLKLSSLYSTTGMYLESKKILESIDRKSLPAELLPLYYDVYGQFYGHYAQSNNRHTYFKLDEAYRDSLLSVLLPESREYKMLRAKKTLYEGGEPDEAETAFLDLYNSMPDNDPFCATIAYFLGNVYKNKNNRELQEKYYTISALYDIRNATKDNASLQALASLYYETGDLVRAYKFTKSAIEDVVFSKVRFRSIEMSEYYSIINAAYQAQVQTQKNELKLSLVFISLLLLMLLAALIYIYRQMRILTKAKADLDVSNRQLKSLNESLSEMNVRLQTANVDLLESNQIKDEYIGRFIKLSSVYVDKLDAYRRVVHRKISGGQTAELLEMTRSRDALEPEFKELYDTFDVAFLQLFPNFINRFNALLQPDAHVIPKKGELLSTELRIFALIRLGISDSSQIAEFLHYSVNTIYNYRAKVKNKSLLPRDDFENTVMQIK
jgi:hypothetical protein